MLSNRRLPQSCSVSPAHHADTLPASHSSSILLQRTVARSLPASARQSPTRPPRIQSTYMTHRRTHRSDTLFPGDKQQVELLSEWNKPLLPSETLSKLRLNEYGFTPRNSQSDVDKHILERRSKSSLPPAQSTTESQVKHIQDLSYRRLLKKQNEHMGKERSHYARRYEDELEKTVAELEDSLKALRTEAEQLRQEASRQRALIVQVESDLKSTRKSLALSDSVEKARNKVFRPEDLARVMVKKSQQQAVLFSKEQECRDTVREAKEKINELRDTADEVDQKASLVDKELEQVKRVQVTHFYRLLSEGKDSRGSGLAWVVMKLWKSGNTVTTAMFPDFLDEQAIHCILFLAQKSLEAEELTAYLQASKPPAVVEAANTHDHWNNIQPRLRAITKNMTVRQPKFSPQRKSKEKLVIFEETTQEAARTQSLTEVLTQYSDVTVIEARVKELKDIIQKAQDAEIRRLTNECFLNNYEKRFKVTLKLLLSAIVGVDVIDRYIATINKEQKTLSEQLAKTKTFYFVSKAS